MKKRPIRVQTVIVIRDGRSAHFVILLEGPKRHSAKQQKLEQKNDFTEFSRIRCPLCRWRPKPSHRWFCAPCDFPEFFQHGCGAYWNTFTTRGRCPDCGHQWRWTACLSCAGWSLHEHWYVRH